MQEIIEPPHAENIVHGSHKSLCAIGINDENRERLHSSVLYNGDSVYMMIEDFKKDMLIIETWQIK